MGATEISKVQGVPGNKGHARLTGISFIFGVIFFMLSGCKEAYDPSVEENLASYLIVEGFINTQGISSFQLSRTQKLKEKGQIKFENGATLQIQNDNGGSFPLVAKGNGLYETSALNLPADREYRLRIVTSGGREYISEYVPVRVSQPVKPSWRLTADGAQILVSSEDPSGKTGYYQWTYEEVWEVKSIKPSILTTIRPAYRRVTERDLKEIADIYTCWTTVRSNRILTASTQGLAQDKVENFELIGIPKGSDRLAVRYSVLVRQLAITKEAFEFFELMKKSSEQLGSIFDPQPTMVRGNIRSTADANEPVIGFVSAGAPSESRLFITSAEAGDWKWTMHCFEIEVENEPDSIYLYHFQDRFIPVGGELDPNSNLPSPRYLFFYSYPQVCVDCRVRGSSTRPSFW